jgi:hypothetical protein
MRRKKKHKCDYRRNGHNGRNFEGLTRFWYRQSRGREKKKETDAEVAASVGDGEETKIWREHTGRDEAGRIEAQGFRRGEGAVRFE